MFTCNLSIIENSIVIKSIYRVTTFKSKCKINFYKASSRPSPSSLLRLPNVQEQLREQQQPTSFLGLYNQTCQNRQNHQPGAIAMKCWKRFALGEFIFFPVCITISSNRRNRVGAEGIGLSFQKMYCF